MTDVVNYKEVKVLPIITSMPDKSELPIPTYPENPVFSTKFKSVNDSKLLHYVQIETLQLPGFVMNPVAIPEGYLSELLYHVMYRRDRREDRLPIFLDNTVCRAPHALGDLVLAARMARGLFSDLAKTIDPTIRKEARNWLLLALQLEYTSALIINDGRDLGPVICKTDTVYGDDTYSETDTTYYLDVDILTDLGLTSEDAVLELLNSLEP